MPDREKVIKGLETCIGCVDTDCSNECPYYESCFRYDARFVFQPILRDALVLLREQEPANVTTRRIPANGGSIVWTCGKCGADLAPNNAKAKYCSACGKPVKWDETD